MQYREINHLTQHRTSRHPFPIPFLLSLHRHYWSQKPPDQSSTRIPSLSPNQLPRPEHNRSEIQVRGLDSCIQTGDEKSMMGGQAWAYCTAAWCLRGVVFRERVGSVDVRHGTGGRVVGDDGCWNVCCACIRSIKCVRTLSARWTRDARLQRSVNIYGVLEQRVARLVMSLYSRIAIGHHASISCSQISEECSPPNTSSQ